MAEGEKLAQSLGVMVHAEPVGHDCYLTQGNWAAAAESRHVNKHVMYQGEN